MRNDLQLLAVALFRQQLWERDGGMCGLCYLPVAIEDMHIDHRVARSMGGGNDLDNLQVTHPSCNQRKGGRRGRKGRVHDGPETIRLPLSLRKRALGVAQDEDRTFSSLVIYALRRYVTEREQDASEIPSR